MDGWTLNSSRSGFNTLKCSTPSNEKHVLLTLDGNYSHKDLAAITYATSARTTHSLQPLDKVFMKSFKGVYFEACGLWMTANSGARIKEYEIAAMVSQDFTNVARLDLAKSGVQWTGILSLNLNVFTDLDFLPSAATEVPMQSVSE